MLDEQRGLYNKYIIQKTDGSAIDPDAAYLVLRLDKGEYVEACRRAALTFASWVCDANPRLFQDIVDWMGRLNAFENREKLPSALEAIDRLGKADAEHPKPPST